MASKEGPLVHSIGQAIRRKYPTAWIFKVVGNPYQTSGIPDLLVLAEGHLFGLEVKHQKPGESLSHARGRATPLQLHQIELIRGAGGTAEVVTSVEEALSLITGVVGGR